MKARRASAIHIPQCNQVFLMAHRFEELHISSLVIPYTIGQENGVPLFPSPSVVKLVLKQRTSVVTPDLSPLYFATQ